MVQNLSPAWLLGAGISGEGVKDSGCRPVVAQDLPSLRSAGAQPRGEARHHDSAAARTSALQDMPLQVRHTSTCEQFVCWTACCPLAEYFCLSHNYRQCCQQGCWMPTSNHAPVQVNSVSCR